MKKQLLINEVSVMVATLFLIASTFTHNIYLILLGFIMMGYSSNRGTATIRVKNSHKTVFSIN